VSRAGDTDTAVLAALLATGVVFESATRGQRHSIGGVALAHPACGGPCDKGRP